MTATVPPAPATGLLAASPREIDDSCRLPLLLLFVSAAIWLVIGSVFALISTLKFHSPNFLADSAWLTYGRVRPAYLNSVLYGFCLQAGLGVGLWLLARLGRAPLARKGLVTVGAAFWNLGVTAGVWGILAGDSTGFESLEMPRYAAVLMFLGYLPMGLWAVLTFHQRRERRLFVAQWFLFAALFWFPWIYSTAELLLAFVPVRGVMQPVIAWWYADNLHLVWLWLVGLGAVFYFMPKLTGRELHSRYLALFTFWMVILFGGWCGIPNGAPVPAWMPALSTAATVLLVIPLLAVGLSVWRTAGCAILTGSAAPPLRFIGFGVVAFLVAGLMRVSGAVPPVSDLVDLTWFTPAQWLLNAYGFFVLVMFGAIYYIVPRLTGVEFPSARLVRTHFWLALLGIWLVAVPLALAGVAEGLKLANAKIAFDDIVKATLPFLRVSTMGDVLLGLGHIVFLVNLVGLARRFLRARAAAVYAAATEDRFTPAEVNA